MFTFFVSKTSEFESFIPDPHPHRQHSGVRAHISGKTTQVHGGEVGAVAGAPRDLTGSTCVPAVQQRSNRRCIWCLIARLCNSVVQNISLFIRNLWSLIKFVDKDAMGRALNELSARSRAQVNVYKWPRELPGTRPAVKPCIASAGRLHNTAIAAAPRGASRAVRREAPQGACLPSAVSSLLLKLALWLLSDAGNGLCEACSGA